MSRTWIAVLFLALPLSFSARAQDRDTDRLLNALNDRTMANQLTTRMRTDERIALYTKLGEAKPENSHYRNLLATALIQKTRETVDFRYLEQARRIIEDVLSEDGQNYEALRLRSEIALERHEFRQVIAHSKEMIRIAPKDSWNYGTLGDAHMELGQYEEAADAYQQMVTIRPGLASYNRAAYYRFIAGDSKGAIELMKMAVGSEGAPPENIAWCLAELGDLQFKTNQSKDAIRSYRQALAMFPGYFKAHAGLGRALAAEGEWEDAIRHYQQAQQSAGFPEYAAALRTLYEKAGKPEESRRQQALVLHPQPIPGVVNDDGQRVLAVLYADQGIELDRALEMAKAELKDHNDVYSHDALAWVLFQRGQYEEAAAASHKAMRMQTGEPIFHYHAGRIAHALGQQESAIRHLQNALAMNPHFDLTQAPVAQSLLKELTDKTEVSR